LATEDSVMKILHSD